MVEKFLEYLEVEKKYAGNTITSYRKDLLDFEKFLLSAEGTSDLRIQDAKIIRNFIYDLSAKGIAKRSINRKISSLRSLYSFLMRIGEVSANPTETIKSIKFYPDQQMPMSEEEMGFLQKEIYAQDADLLKIAITETLYQTGIRKAELCGLQISDVDFSASELRVKGKGNKERIVPLSTDLQGILQKYMPQRKPLPKFEKYFFINAKGKKLGEKFVYSIVNNYLSLITSKKKKSPHMLRHSFATHLLNNGAEISKVKKLMGHASLASTQVYTHADIQQLKKVFNNAHPRAKKE